MTKIAVINFYQGLANRGGEVFVEEFAKRLSIKNDVYVYQAGSKPSNFFKTICFSVKYNPKNSDKNTSVKSLKKRLFLDYDSRKIFLFTLKIIPNLLRFKPQVIYPLNSGWQIFILKIISLYTKSKIIVGGHSGPGWNDRVNLFFKPDVFVALTHVQEKWAKRALLWRNQKIIVIPNGIDMTKFKPKKEVVKKSYNNPVILCVAAAITSKRVSETIKAVSLLKDTSLLVVGTGPNEKVEDDLGKKLLGSNFKRMKIDSKKMPEVYQNSDIFTLCSDNSEAFGIVYLEALATGLNCVVTDDNSRREILDDTGFYVANPQDPNEYSKMIKIALEKKQFNKNIDQAKKYSWSIVIDQYQKIIDNEV